MRYVLVVLLVVALPFMLAFERDISYEFEGRIEQESELESGDTATVVNISGHGKVDAVEVTDADGVGQDRAVALEIEGEGDPVVGDIKRSLEVIAGAKARGGHYVTRAEVLGGEVGELSMATDVTDDYMEMLKVAQISLGVYERHVDLARPDVSLSEVVEIVGSGELKDKLRFEFDEEVDE